MISVRGVGFGFAGREVLRGVTFGVEAGTATALIGANGVGKTTLLRVMAGLLEASAGEVLLDGVGVRGMGRREVAKRVALVPQRLEVPFPFTVRQIVEQGRTPYLRGMRGMGVADRVAVERAMERVDVLGMAGRVFNELSGGERQRVKIALGLAQEAEVMLLDEPTESLDVGRQGELMSLLSGLRADGMTILASIHDLHLVRGNFERVVLLGPGCSMIEGPAEEVMTGDTLEWGFDCPPGRGFGGLRDTYGRVG